ncbi:hypothetical protein FVF58_47730 [Paraburkholderia panacisoli]|uniref:Uncharacterized protein n=1 Tax=Paraburkholderia panacisoli TaxID=2603818 RepID=A0A5B0G4Z8_9BURK|nr:hypothetical protein [Paraburkholderia panacisoli]KAA0997725.1 hypothetical protein FVF58_47730 [Paraburkholderia panacisoli]
MAAKIETLKEVAKAYFIRLYMIENGMLPELAQLTTMDEDGKPLVDVYRMQTEHIEQLQKAFGDFFKDLLPITNLANEKFKAVQAKSTTEATDSYSSSSDTSGGGEYGFGEAAKGTWVAAGCPTLAVQASVAWRRVRARARARPRQRRRNSAAALNAARPRRMSRNRQGRKKRRKTRKRVKKVRNPDWIDVP